MMTPAEHSQHLTVPLNSISLHKNRQRMMSSCVDVDEQSIDGTEYHRRW